MAAKQTEYKENLYQWIWQNLEFDCQNLKTVCGKPVQIVNNGIINHGAGPDFLGAAIHINGLRWFGAVEIHRKSSDWERHDHQNDPRYDRVFLHVVFQHDVPGPVKTCSGLVPYTLCLKPYMHRSLYRLAEIKENSGLACAGNPVFIHQNAFRAQLKKANSEYLGYKVEELLKDYPVGVPVSKAWKFCVVMRLYHTLGMPSNRQQMWNVAHKAVKINAEEMSANEFAGIIRKIAFSGTHGIYTDEWVYTGMRPASRPVVRVEQAAYLHHALQLFPFRRFLDNPETAWPALLDMIPDEYKPGQTMLGILRHTVMIPALYLLGDLLHSASLKNWAKEEWDTSGIAMPAEVKNPFINAGYDLKEEKNLPGLAHQLKRYCRARNCHRCEVFKNAIGS
ncbi:MAG: DUF2851 family protein [Balneolaceae bacterium]|nr:MAG: DUF2851 family protein [Balneolaceae bacterium]